MRQPTLWLAFGLFFWSPAACTWEAHERPCVRGEAAPCTCASGESGAQMCSARGEWSACECVPARACEPGATVECPCSDGNTGSQRCSADGTRFSECHCDGVSYDGGTPLDAWGECAPGAVEACACRDGAGSSRSCTDASSWGPCECWIDAGTPRCTGEPEWCNALDDDCDGRVDESYPCRDPSVTATLPWTGSIWLPSDTPDGAALIRAWPSSSPPAELRVATGIPGNAVFASDGSVFHEVGLSLYRFDGVRDELVELAGCPYLVRFGIDSGDRLTAECDVGIVRDGAIVVARGSPLLAVLPGGELLTTNAPTGGDTYEIVLRDVDGTELSRRRFDDWIGTVTPLYGCGTTSGSDGSVYFAVSRVYATVRQEVVVFRADPRARVIALVRRVELDERLPENARGILPLPDGRLIRLRDRWLAPGWEISLEEHEVDGSVRVLLRATSDDLVRPMTRSTPVPGPVP